MSAVTSHAARMLFVSMAAACHPLDPPPDLKDPCVPGYPMGEVLTVRLGQPYDAKSDYLYDSSLVSYGPRFYGVSYYAVAMSCNGVDSLSPGSVVTFALDTRLNWGQETHGDCAPLVEFDPPTLESNDLVAQAVFGVQGESIAMKFTEPPAGSQAAWRALALDTPTMDPNGALILRQLPPLIVRRQLGAAQGGIVCADAWVATWEPTDD